MPETAVVTTAPDALKISVRAVTSAHNFDASALSLSFPSPVSRQRQATNHHVVFAFTLVEPGALDTITTVHQPVVPTVVQLLGPTKLPAPVSVNVNVVPAGAL